jgi:hypothetical protein
MFASLITLQTWGEKKEKKPWLCEGGEPPANLLAPYDFLTGSTQS